MPDSRRQQEVARAVPMPTCLLTSQNEYLCRWQPMFPECSRGQRGMNDAASAVAQDGFPLGDRAGLVADLHLRTVSTMDKLRETLRDEHSFLMQVGRATTSVQLSSSHRISATCIDLSCHTPGSEHASFDDVYATSANCPYDSIPRLRADYILCPLAVHADGVAAGVHAVPGRAAGRADVPAQR